MGHKIVCQLFDPAPGDPIFLAASSQRSPPAGEYETAVRSTALRALCWRKTDEGILSLKTDLVPPPLDVLFKCWFF